VSEIIQLLSDLFKLSFKIRNLVTRSTAQSSLKALLHKEMVTTDETTVDLMEAYAPFDRGHVQEFFRELWRPDHAVSDTSPETRTASINHPSPDEAASTYLIDRWAQSITNRRRYFYYWRRHARKLATSVGEDDEERRLSKQNILLPQAAQNPGQVTLPIASTGLLAATPSVAGKTVLSGTEVTSYDRTLDEDLETQSTISYTSTAYDAVDGAAKLPPPPATQPSQFEFECPHCWVVCPVRHLRRKHWRYVSFACVLLRDPTECAIDSWVSISGGYNLTNGGNREHILQDLQPYMCTYPDCPEPDAMYTNRASWLDHEAQAHRKVWRCFEHSDLFRTKEELQHHLSIAHSALGSVQAQALADLGSAITQDERKACPFCFATGPYHKDLANHMASHMENLACFSVLRSAGTDESESSADGSSGHARGDRSKDSLKSIDLDFPDQSSDGIEESHGVDPVILEHDDEVNAVAFSPDGRLLASGSDHAVRIWDLSTHQCVKFLGEMDIVMSVSFTLDGSAVALVARDSPSIRIWDLATFKCTILESATALGKRRRSGFWAAASSPVHHLLAAVPIIEDTDHAEFVDLWDLTTATCSQTLQGHMRAVNWLAFSPDGLQLASASEDSKVKLWNPETGECTRTFLGHRRIVKVVTFLPDGLLLATGSDDGLVKIWDVGTTKCIRTLQGHTADVLSVAASPNCSYLASGSFDKTIRVWDVETGECILTLEDHREVVSSVAFSPDGSRLVSSSYDHTVRIWPIRRLLRQKGWN